MAVLLAGCTTPTPDAPGSGGLSEDVLESRELLGQPMVDLATAVIALSELVDAARHKVPRGEDMSEQVRAMPKAVKKVEEAADAAERSAAEAPVTAAADIVEAAAASARAAAEDAGVEQDFLADVAAVDIALLEAAAVWDEPGSQSEIRLRLEELAKDVAKQEKPILALQPQPPSCSVMKANRKEWLRTVRSRTVKLQQFADGSGGSTYDDLRSAYRRLPFGVEARTADAADRECWRTKSDVASAAEDVRAAVEDLEAALKG
jgi:cell division septation protein DedD